MPKRPDFLRRYRLAGLSLLQWLSLLLLVAGLFLWFYELPG